LVVAGVWVCQRRLWFLSDEIEFASIGVLAQAGNQLDTGKDQGNLFDNHDCILSATGFVTSMIPSKKDIFCFARVILWFNGV
jgi:hypothetical protein